MIAFLSFVAVLSSCTSRDSATAPVVPGVTRVAASPRSVVLTVGGSATLSAKVDGPTGAATVRSVTWRSLDPGIVAVNDSGTVTASSTGVTEVVVSSVGAVDDSVTVNVTSAPLPALPRNLVDTRLVAPTRTIPVRRGSDLQAALAAAQPGDELVLDAGATYTGNFVLPAKAGAGPGAWVTIRSAALGQLPPEGTRMNPRYAALLPKLVSPNASPAVATEAGASYYRFIGVEVTAAAGQTLNYGLVTLGDGAPQTTLAQVPHHLILDRVYVHGTPTLNLSRCVAFNSAWSAVIDSYLSECHAKGFDSQAIGGWNGPGPFKIVDNYLEAAGENILFGGADPSIPGMNPSDIEVRHNHIIKPPSWRGVWTVKNLFELKDARRVLLEGNVLENCWTDAQTGSAILMQALTDGNTAPWTTVQDVTIRYNWIKNASAGATVASRVAYNTGGTTPVLPTEPSQRISFQNNLFENIGIEPGAQHLIALYGDLQNASVLHNTGAATKAALLFDGDPQAGLVVQDNVFGKGDYGIFGSGKGEGLAALAYYAPGAVVRRNVIFGNTATGGPVNPALYPSDNSYPATAAAVGFVNWGTGLSALLTDFALSGASPYLNTASDGTTPGADLPGLQAALQGVVQP